MSESADGQAKHPGERLATFFDNFFKTILSVSTLGASITFSKIVDPPSPPLFGPFSGTTTKSYLGVSWLLFLLDLAATAFATCAFTLYRPQAISYFGTENSDRRRIVMWYASAVSALLFGILIIAFLFLGLVVVSYAGGTGWVAVALSAFAGAVGGACIIWQSPIGSPAIGGVSRQGTGLDDNAGPQRFGGGPQRLGSYKEQAYYGEEVGHGDEDKYGAGTYNDGNGYDDGRRRNYGEVQQASIARPMVAEVPGYLADMRRFRHSKDSGYDVKY